MAEHRGLTASLQLQAHLSNKLQAFCCHGLPHPGLEVISQLLPLLLLLQILSQWETWELPESSQETWEGGMTEMWDSKGHRQEH